MSTMILMSLNVIGREIPRDKGSHYRFLQLLIDMPHATWGTPSPSRLLRRDLITGRGGLQNGKIAGPKLFAPPPPQDGKTFHAPPPF